MERVSVNIYSYSEREKDFISEHVQVSAFLKMQGKIFRTEL